MNRVAMSPDGKRLATGTWRGMDIKIWDTTSGELLATLPTGENAAPLWQSAHTIVSVQLTEAAQWLEDPVTREWRRGESWLPDPGGNFWVDGALSPDGRRLALPHSGDRVRLLDLTTGAELITLEAPKPFGLTFVRFSPDGRSLAASGEREQVAIWDLPELRRELAELSLDWAD
jgi:WD40 repeat protein